MRAKVVPLIISIFFVIIFFIFFKGLKNSNIYVPSVKLDKKIPSFVVYSFDTNNKISSDQIFKDNKYYLLNIWSSWCLPCKDEHKFLMKLKKKENLELIGLNYKDNVLNAKNFLDELKNPYAQIFSDQDGLIAIEWGAYGVPESILIYNKKMIKKVIGPLNKSLVFEIEELIK